LHHSPDPKKHCTGAAGRRNAPRLKDPEKPGHLADMTKAARVAQGGADGPRIQGIGGQFRTIPTVYRPNENRRPGAWPERRKNGAEKPRAAYS